MTRHMHLDYKEKTAVIFNVHFAPYKHINKNTGTNWDDIIVCCVCARIEITASHLIQAASRTVSDNKTVSS